MTTTVEKIADGVVVTLAYTLIADGLEVESATADDPLDYLHGAENIVPGLENALAGRKVGDRFEITLQPEDAYGIYDETDVEVIERDDIPDSEDIEPGMVLLLEDEDGNAFDGIVTDVTENAIVVDFNPPLAGKVVTYKVEVLGMRPADEEELEHGHPHGFDDFSDYDDEDYDEE